MVALGRKWLNSGKEVVLGQDIVFGQGGSIRAKLVVFGQSDCIREGGCIGAMWLYSGKVVVFGQNLLYSNKSGCIR